MTETYLNLEAQAIIKYTFLKWITSDYITYYDEVCKIFSYIFSIQKQFFETAILRMTSRNKFFSYVRKKAYLHMI